MLTKSNGFEFSCLARRRLNLIPNMKFQVQLRRRQASPTIRQVCQIRMKFVWAVWRLHSKKVVSLLILPYWMKRMMLMWVLLSVLYVNSLNIDFLFRLPPSTHSVIAQLVSQLHWKNTKDTIPQRRANICTQAAPKHPKSITNTQNTNMTTPYRPPVKTNTKPILITKTSEIHQKQIFLPFLPQYHVIKYWIRQIVTTMR